MNESTADRRRGKPEPYRRFVDSVAGRWGGSRGLSSARVLVLAAGVLLVGFPTARAQVAQIQVSEEMLVSWVFNNARHSNLRQARQELDQVREMRLDLIETACELTPQQRRKLELAASGDVHRFFNEYENLRRTMPTGNVSQEEYQKLWQRVQPLRQKFTAGLHARDSLFVRSIPYVLDESQRSRYEEFEGLRRARRFESLVKGTIAMIESEIPLTENQRERLLKRVLAEEPPRRIDSQSYYQNYLVLIKMSKIPQEELKPIFLENEWAAFRQLLMNAARYEQMLRNEGLLDDDEQMP
jgi:hypothetical protein